MKPSLILLHGLFGGLSNWEYLAENFANDYKVYIPQLPIFEENDGNKLDYLTEFIHQYVNENNISDCVLIGNSLGGHIAILYSHKYLQFVKGLVLTGSSALFENSMLERFPRRHDFDYITERVQYTFYNPSTTTESLIADVYDIACDNKKFKTAKTAQRNYVRKEISEINIPVLLIWGNQDKITPPEVAHEFHSLLKNSGLKFIDECGHAPMTEKPLAFNTLVSEYLLNV